MLLVVVVQCSMYFILWFVQTTGSSKVTLLCLFDSDVEDDCHQVLTSFPSFQGSPNSSYVEARTLLASPDVRSTIADIEASVNAQRPDVIFTVGGIGTANTASMFAQYFLLPQVSLATDSMAKPLFSNTLMRFGPTGSEMAEAVFYMINMQNTTGVSVIYQQEHSYDDFLINMKDQAMRSPHVKRFKVLGSSEKGCNDQSFLRKLIDIRDNGSRLFILHAGQEVTNQVLRCAVKYDMFQTGHVWLLTKRHFRNDKDMAELPVGILALEYSPSKGFKTEIRDGLRGIVSACSLQSQDNRLGICQHDQTGLRKADLFLRTLSMNWQKPKVTYNLLNLVKEKDRVTWHTVGSVQRDSFSVDTIIWPGGFIYGPGASTKKFLRVATAPAPPFVHYRESDNDEQQCYTDTPCLELKKTDRVLDYLDAYANGGPPADLQFNFLCCSGLSVDLINQLAKDLDFDFVLYFFPDTVNRIGKLVNKTWDGVIGQVYYGTADIMIGAFSITAARSEWIDFTVPFYQSGFTMLSVAQDQVISIGAFMEPFSPTLWLSIVGAASITAVISSFLEWHSPYGLNPWGRKRERNFTLGSSLVSVYSLAFGHIFATKSPKSWPCRFVLNVWAVFAIFIIASYTANLAAFLAGKENVVFYKGPTDPALASQRVAVIGETSVAGYIEKLYPELNARLNKTSLRTSKDMITEMKNKMFDVFIHDLPILEYARARLDGDCTLRLVGSTFGQDGYGIGLPKLSEWKAPMSELILSYGVSGFLDDLEKTHFSELICSSNGLKQQDLQYSPVHTGGLFIMLGVAIGLCFLLLLVEHLFYRHCLTRLRNKPADSIFKNIHMMFFSQRLHRSTTCEEIAPPSQGAKEMLSQVKNKAFIDLFLKEQRKTAVQQNLTLPTTMTIKQCVTLANSLKGKDLSNGSNEINLSPMPSSSQVEEVYLHGEEGLTVDNSSAVVVDDSGSILGDIELNHFDHVTLSSSSADETSEQAEDDWPSNWEEEWVNQSTGDTIVPMNEDSGELQGHENPGFVMNNERHQNSAVVKRNISLKETERVRNAHPKPVLGKFVKSYSWRPSKDFATGSNDNAHHRHAGNERASYSISENIVYNKTPNMKDNRTKSRVRRDTLEQLCRAFSVDLIDSFTLESLSKSELLVLWKASEINLRRQLGEMARQKESLLSLLDKETTDTNPQSSQP